MIGYISGTIKAIRKNFLIVATDHVGYKVFVTPHISLSLEPGKPISLFVHTYVREDQLSLYGFPTLPELEFFEMLISVTGVGPKMAMSIMSLDSIEMIQSGIASEDAGVFTKVSGVGRKTAERLIIELREKITALSTVDRADLSKLSQNQADVLDALMALGYSRTEARQAIAQVPKDTLTSQDKIREALKALAKQ